LLSCQDEIIFAIYAPAANPSEPDRLLETYQFTCSYNEGNLSGSTSDQKSTEPRITVSLVDGQRVANGGADLRKVFFFTVSWIFDFVFVY
jgi:hypothetical protein